MPTMGSVAVLTPLRSKRGQASAVAVPENLEDDTSTCEMGTLSESKDSDIRGKETKKGGRGW